MLKQKRGCVQFEVVLSLYSTIHIQFLRKTSEVDDQIIKCAWGKNLNIRRVHINVYSL